MSVGTESSGVRVQNYFTHERVNERTFDADIAEVKDLIAQEKIEDAYIKGASILGKDKLIKNLLKSLDKVKKKPKKDKDKDKDKDKEKKTLDSVHTKMMSIAVKRLTPSQFNLFRKAF